MTDQAKTVKWKPCEICGKPVAYLRADKKYCPACAKDRAREMARLSKLKKRHERPKFCNCCGARLDGEEVRFCRYCKSLTPAQRKAEREKREAKRTAPKPAYSVDQLAQLARQYRSPYNSYGKLRAYLGTTGKLPPDGYRRQGL